MDNVELQPNSVELGRLVKEILARKKHIFLLSLFFITIMMAYFLTRPPVKQSSILIKLENSASAQERVANFTSLASNITHASLSTQIALMKSEFILGPVIRKLALDLTITERKSLLNKLIPNHHHHAQKKLLIEALDLPHRIMLKPLHVKVLKDGYLLQDRKANLLLKAAFGETAIQHGIKMQVKNIAAMEGQEFVVVKRQLGQVVNELKNQLLVTDLTGNIDPTSGISILRVSLNSKNPKLTAKTLGEILMTFSDKNLAAQTADIDQNLKFLQRKLVQISDSINQEEVLVTEYRRKHQGRTLKEESTYLNNQIMLLEKQLLTMQVKKEKLLADYTLKHPLMRSYQTLYAALNQKLAASALRLNQLSLEEQTLKPHLRNIEVQKNIYINILKQIQDLEMKKDNAKSSIEMLSPITTQTITSPLPWPLALILCALLSTVISTLLISLHLISQQMSRNYNTPLTE